MQDARTDEFTFNQKVDKHQRMTGLTRQLKEHLHREKIISKILSKITTLMVVPITVYIAVDSGE